MSEGSKNGYHAPHPIACGINVYEGISGMPSLFRFLALVGVLAGLTVGGMIALDTLVEPTPRDMSERIPPAKLRQ